MIKAVLATPAGAKHLRQSAAAAGRPYKLDSDGRFSFDPSRFFANATVAIESTNWTCAARAIWTLVEVERLLLAAPAVQLRTARTGRSLVGLDGSETADALLRLLAAGHHGTDGKPTAAGTTASFDPRSAISGADLRLGPGGLGRLAQGPMVGLLLVVSTERNERNTICLFIGGS